MKCETLYLCNPEKNVKCNKQKCYIGNGPCHCTHNKSYAFYIEDTPVIVMTKIDQEFYVKNGMNLLEHLEIATKVAIKLYNRHH